MMMLQEQLTYNETMKGHVEEEPDVTRSVVKEEEVSSSLFDLTSLPNDAGENKEEGKESQEERQEKPPEEGKVRYYHHHYYYHHYYYLHQNGRCMLLPRGIWTSDKQCQCSWILFK